MKRKIIKLGQATYVLSLPSKWIREHTLEKGDYLEVEDDNGKLIVSSQKTPLRKELMVSIDVSNYNRRSITMILQQVYRKGFDKLHVKFKTKDQLDVIRKVAKNTLLGFEIVAEENKKCILHNIAEPTSEKFDVIMRKAMLLVKEDIAEILEDLKSADNRLNRHQETKESFDNFKNFIQRVIIRDKITGSTNSYFLYTFVSQLSVIQHGFYYLYKTAAREGSVNKLVLEEFEKLQECYQMLYDAFYRRDLTRAHDARIKADTLLKELQLLVTKGKGAQNKYFMLLANIVRAITNASTILFGMNFDEPKDVV